MRTMACDRILNKKGNYRTIWMCWSLFCSIIQYTHVFAEIQEVTCKETDHSAVDSQGYRTGLDKEGAFILGLLLEFAVTHTG